MALLSGLAPTRLPSQNRCPACGSSVKTLRADRPFYLTDVMLLVAASAVAAALARPTTLGRFAMARGAQGILPLFVWGTILWTIAVAG